MDALDTYDLFQYGQLLGQRLTEAFARFESSSPSEVEKSWLRQARELAMRHLPQAEEQIFLGRLLPELTEVRAHFAGRFQDAYVEALEKLHAGITFHAGSRAPIIEALFPHLKFPSLRKASASALSDYQAELCRRLKLSYAQRILQEPEFAFAQPVLEQLEKAQADWESSFSEQGLPDGDPAPLRLVLTELAEKMDLAFRQAKLLSEAALAPRPGWFEELGLNAKMRRSKRAVDSERILSIAR